MQILRVEDPRDSLSKASRYELCQLAKAQGISEITYECDLELNQMVDILRKRGITSISIPDRQLGDYRPLVLNADDVSPEKTVESRVHAPAVEKQVSEMNMNELRSACKARGIKMARTDNLESLRAKLG